MYLTTVVEQEINHTVLINNDLAKRCIWLQNVCSDQNQPQPNDKNSNVILDNDRRLKNLHKDLLNQLPENQIFSSAFVYNTQVEQLTTTVVATMSGIVENIMEDYKNKVAVPYCTYGVDRRLLTELQAIDNYIKCLTQNRANFKLLDSIKR